jgi:dihydroorotate dehydrogenase (NAD+) catalytic subunit
VSTSLATSLAGISLRNPVILAAGTCGTIDEFGDVLDLSRIGGLVTKSITRQAREGNKPWRIVETRHGGMLNAIGLANPGIEAFESHTLARVARSGMPCAVIGSVAGFSVEDYVVVAATMDEWGKGIGSRGAPSAGSGSGEAAGVERGVEAANGVPDSRGANPEVASRAPSEPKPMFDAIELNVSCPNVKSGTDFGSSPVALREVVSEVRRVVSRCRLIVKLSPWGQGLPEIAAAAIEAGAEALTISNTIPAMAIDVRTRRPRLANITGGFSGPGLHPVALKLVHDVYRRVAKAAGVPIIGAGGVLRWEDAAEFILAGASAVQMGTALFVDPRSPLGVVKGLEKWVREQGCLSIGELVGAVRLD